ncbi:TPA: hypothetical protein DEP94_02900 [Candidatus Nomurabacteria bacterium]|nr:hypothetical protein [Candidatus Nomurabacteria bacterium]
MNEAFLERKNEKLLSDLLEAQKPTLQMRPLTGKYSHLAVQVLITRDGYLAIPYPKDRVIKLIKDLDPNVIDGFSPRNCLEMDGPNPDFSYFWVLGADYRYDKVRVEEILGLHSI